MGKGDIASLVSVLLPFLISFKVPQANTKV